MWEFEKENKDFRQEQGEIDSNQGNSRKSQSA